MSDRLTKNNRDGIADHSAENLEVGRAALRDERIAFREPLQDGSFPQRYRTILFRMTEAAIAELAAALASGVTPPPTPHRARCKACSLRNLCRPETVARPVLAWRDRMIAQSMEGL